MVAKKKASALYNSFKQALYKHFVCIRDRIDILETISMLVLVNKKVSSKNPIFPSLLKSKAPTKTILKAIQADLEIVGY